MTHVFGVQDSGTLPPPVGRAMKKQLTKHVSLSREQLWRFSKPNPVTFCVMFVPGRTLLGEKAARIAAFDVLRCNSKLSL